MNAGVCNLYETPIPKKEKYTMYMYTLFQQFIFGNNNDKTDQTMY
jgi:hypothetical protein